MSWRSVLGFRKLARHGAMVIFCAVLAACTTQMLENAPPDPAKPWQPKTTGSNAGTARSAGDFGVEGPPEVSALQPTPDISSDKTYGLPELIDIAQTRNPLTRVAWQQARQAALAAGMVEATYLPFISANVIAGRQEVTQPLPIPIGGRDDVTTTVDGVSPQIALQWLVFDFGQRSALHAAARHNSDAANVLFNGAHQTIIYDVTRGYFLYGAARNRVRSAQQSLSNSRKIEDAAQARSQKGIGTTIELAQARQAVAQAQFGLVQAQGTEKDSYQALLAAMGVSPMTKMRIKEPGSRRLPQDVGKPTEAMIKAALTRRPDVLASFSAMKASESGIKAAQAELMPKVFLGAVAATGSTNLSASGLPTIGQQASTSGVMIGATLPLFDGGLRQAQLANAQSLAAASAATFEKTRDAAAREIVVSTEALRSALASHRAASALTQASAVTYDAALDSYRAGIGNITVATAANSGLLAARQGEADGYTASLVAAANLAFVLGAMTSGDSVAQR
jgi:outer membrane protein TolC